MKNDGSQQAAGTVIEPGQSDSEAGDGHDAGQGIMDDSKEHSGEDGGSQHRSVTQEPTKEQSTEEQFFHPWSHDDHIHHDQKLQQGFVVLKSIQKQGNRLLRNHFMTESLQQSTPQQCDRKMNGDPCQTCQDPVFQATEDGPIPAEEQGGGFGTVLLPKPGINQDQKNQDQIAQRQSEKKGACLLCGQDRGRRFR